MDVVKLKDDIIRSQKLELDILRSQKLELDILRSQKLELEKLLSALTSNTGGSMMKPDRSPSTSNTGGSMIKSDRSPSGTTNKDDKKAVPGNKTELDYVNRELDILWLGISKINALASDAAGVIDPSGQNSYSNTSKVTNISTHQGGFIQDAGGDAFSEVVNSIHRMFTSAKGLSGTIDGNDSNTVIISKSELDLLKSQKLELDILWSGVTKINALTRDAAGPNSYSNTSKVTKKSNIILFHHNLYYILSGRCSGSSFVSSKQCCEYDFCSSRVAKTSRF